MSYQMGTAQLQTWQRLNLAPDQRQNISFKINGVDLVPLQEALKRTLDPHGVLTAKLVESPEFNNPVMIEGADESRVYVGIDESAAAASHYNVAFCLKSYKNAVLLECAFDPVIVDLHSVMAFVSQTLKALSGDETSAESRIDFSKYAAWSNDIINEEEPAAKVLWDNLYKQRRQWSDIPFGFEIKQEEAEGSYGQVEAKLTLPGNPFTKEQLATAPLPLALSLLYIYYSLNADSSPVLDVALNGRAFEELQSIIGPLTRMVPFALNGEKESSFAALQEKIKARWLEMEEWQEYAPGGVIEQAEMRQRTSFRFIDQQQYFDDLSIEIAQAKSGDGALFNWHFVLKPNGVLVVLLEFDEQAISKALAELILDQFSHLAGQLLKHPEEDFSKIQRLSEREKLDYLQTFPGTKMAGSNYTLCSLFDKAAEVNPDAVAIWYKEKPHTYQQLKARADALASLIHEQLKGRSSAVVAVEIPSSPEQVMALLAVMKAGYSYLPVDSELPVGRKQQLLQIAKAAALIHNGRQTGSGYELEDLISIDLQSVSAGEPKQLRPVNSEQQAYIIFTSGSTGEPKGVPITHRNIVNTVLWRIDTYRFDTDTVTLQLPEYSFDSSVEDIFCTLAAGGSLVLTDKELKKEIIHLRQLIASKGVTHFLIVPSLYKTLLPHLKEGAGNIKCITVAGEALPASLAEAHFTSLPQVALVNEYGPTECSVCTSYIKLSPNENINIGRPIGNMSVFVVGEQNELLPVGQKGRLLVSGPGVFEGYLADEATDPEYFVDLEIDGEHFKCYNTGDYCRFSHDGNLYFEGREDDQIKLRGYRINLVEIEKRILENDSVTECLVLVDKDQSQAGILAYFIAENEEQGLEKTLESSLKAVLPAYMLPNHYVEVSEWPLNKNGKTDRHQLKQFFQHTTQLLLPQTEQEKVLLKVWRSVLNKAEISIDDDFYKIGGDSIKSIQIAAALFELGYQLKVKEIFQNPVLKDQARIMIRQQVSVSSQEPVYGEVPLSPIQKYFFSLPGWLDKHFCQSVLLKLNERAKTSEIQACVDRLIEHHDMLRAHYHTSPVSQEVTDKDTKVLVLESADADAVSFIEQRATGFFQKADLKTQDLFQVVQINHKEEIYLLILAHHLLIDTMSWRILLEDFNRLLQQVNEREELSLSLKTESYKVFAEELLKQRERRNEATIHYLDEVQNFDNAGFLSHVKTVNSQVSEEIKVRLSVEETKVSAIGQYLSNSRLMWRDLLLAMLGKVMKNLFGQDRMLVFIESHGRESTLNFNKTIGWFTNVFPAVLPTNSSDMLGLVKDLSGSLARLHELGVNYYAHQEFEIYKGHAISRPHDVIFNFLGDFDSDIERLSAFEVVKQGFEGEMAWKRNRESVLEVFAWVQNRKLEIEFIFSESQLDHALIERFSEIYTAEIDDFLNAGAIEDSRFDYDELSEEDLQTLFD